MLLVMVVVVLKDMKWMFKVISGDMEIIMEPVLKKNMMMKNDYF